jgi:hypothetical protein
MVANMTSNHVMAAARLGLLGEAVLDGKPAFSVKLTTVAPPLVVAWAAGTSMEGLIELGRLAEADGIASAALAARAARAKVSDAVGPRLSSRAARPVDNLVSYPHAVRCG